jgi:hypothetical protein
MTASLAVTVASQGNVGVCHLAVQVALVPKPGPFDFPLRIPARLQLARRASSGCHRATDHA